ncbi:MAG TPA: HAD-IC family P-type ATPase [Candidatus Pacearchaeota archaeon]|nr:HAD-IC family P-type ATPase [Candidatus Pacearchaeota archaeon]
MNWYNLSPDEVIQKLDSRLSGLKEQEVKERISQVGPNKLPEAKVDSLLTIFWHQFRSPLIYVLLGAGLVFFLLGDYIDGLIVLAVLTFNAVIGTVQEGKAQNALTALKKFVETNTTVIREGRELIVADKEIVPGDIIVLQEGEKIPADARVIESHQVRIDEAALTGKSHPIYKKAEAIKGEAVLADQMNMVFKGTYVLAGVGRAVVVGTGVNTAIGQVSQEIAAIDTTSPLKDNIKKLSHLIIVAFAVVAAGLFSFAWLTGRNMLETFEVIVAIAVSVIPEGLPVVITLVLATGVWRMGKRNVLVKRLQAVESLGEAHVIAIDKTGTITKNELVVRELYVSGQHFRVTGVGYQPEGRVLFNDHPADEKRWPELFRVAQAAAFAGSARLAYLEEEDRWRVAGDPTEAALQVLAQKMGVRREDLLKEKPVIQRMPFDYQAKYQAAVFQEGDRKTLIVVGAPEIVVDFCSGWQKEDKRLQLTAERKAELKQIFEAMAEDGLRVLAFAEREVSGSVDSKNLPKLNFLGFCGMRDAIRPEAARAVRKLQAAGLKVAMITGDYEAAARAVAREANIFLEGDRSLSGSELDQMSDEELEMKLNRVSVFARVTPKHKLRIVKAYRRRKEVVAMTGDGVNDAPSLMAADLGVAMGRLGTEVAKEASDIILLDDNLESIVAAVEEGRGIYQSIKRVILYLFATSAGEILLISAAFLLRLPLPLTAAQIIWLNVVTDGSLDVALAFEPKAEGLLKAKSRKTKQHLVDSLMGLRILLMSVPMMLGTLWLFSQYSNFADFDLAKAQTLALTTMAISQWFNAWNCRSQNKSIFQLNPLSNRWLLGVMLAVIPLQMLVVYNPWMQAVFRTTSLTLSEWLMAISLAATVIIGEEIRKMITVRVKLKWSS